MSVPKGKRYESDLVVINKANDLTMYTIRICSNEKKFPKRYRWCVTKNIVEAAVKMRENISKANSVHVNDEKSYILRRTYQQMAMAELAAMNVSMNIAFELFDGLKHIPNEKTQEVNIAYWTQELMETKRLLQAWKKSDAERYKRNA